MKFGKYLEARQLELPEYNGHFINYKQLKKLIKQLSLKRIEKEMVFHAQSSSVEPVLPKKNENESALEYTGDSLLHEYYGSNGQNINETVDHKSEPVYENLGNKSEPVYETLDHTSEPVYEILKCNKGHFFFKLERELEKVNDFYLEKESYFMSMIDILQRKFLEYKKTGRLVNQSSSSYKYLFESLKRFQREIDHLTQFIDLNRTGFGKVLKKWDKRSHSHTKDFYLATVVSIQPIFTHSSDVALMTDLSTSLLLELEEIREQAQFQGLSSSDVPALKFSALDFNNNYVFNKSFLGSPVDLIVNEVNSPIELNKLVTDSEEFLLSIELEIDGWSKEVESISQLKDLEPRLLRIKNFPAKVIHFITAYDSGLKSNNSILIPVITKALTKLFFLCVGNEKISDECLEEYFNSCNELKNVGIDLLMLDSEDSYVLNKRNFFHEAAACKLQSRSFIFNAAINLYSGDEIFYNYLLAQDMIGRTPLHYACELNKVQIVVQTIELITKNKAKLLDSLKMIDKSSNTPLLIAIKNNNESIVDHLLTTFSDLSYHSDFSLSPSKQISPLNIACAHTNYFIIKTVLKHMFNGKQNIDEYIDNQGYKPLHLACENGADAKILKLLYSYGCDPNTFDVANKWTPLVYAVVNNHEDTVISLINDCHCDISLGDSKNLSPLFYACWQGSVSIINILLNKYKQEANQIGKNKSLNSKQTKDVPKTFDNTSSVSATNNENFTAFKPLETGILKPQQPSFNLDDLENFKIGDSESIPDLKLPPPYIPLKKYGHNFLEKKYFLKLHFGPGLACINLNNEHTDTISLSHLGRITLTSNASDLISKNISLPIETLSKAKALTNVSDKNSSVSTRNNSATGFSDQKLSYAVKDLLSIGDSIDEAIFQFSDLKTCQIDAEIYSISGTKMVTKTVITYETLRNSMKSATNDGFITLPLLDSRLKLMGQLCFDFHIISPFDSYLPNLNVSHLETYWRSAASINSNVDGSSETTVISSLSGGYLTLLVTLLNDGTIVVAPSLTVDVMGTSMLLIDLNRNQLEIFTQKKLSDVDELVKDFSCIDKYIQNNYILLDSLLGIMPSNIKIDVKVCFPTLDEIKNVPVKVESSKVNIDTFVDSVLNIVLWFIRTNCGGSTKRVVFSSSNHMICSILNWKQPVFPVVFNMNGIVLNKKYEFEIESQNHLLSQSIDKESFYSSDGFNYQSVKEVVTFSKNNNLLGVIIPTHFLLLCKELINEIKACDLLLIAGGISKKDLNDYSDILDDPLINGYKTEQNLFFKCEGETSN